MELNAIRSAYYEKSGQASELARKLGFAGIAIIWVFREQGADVVDLHQQLVLAGILIVGALAADFLQYVYGALAWGIFHRVKERGFQKGESEEDLPRPDIEAPDWINWPSLFFFWSKIVAILWAYMILLTYLGSRFQESAN